MRSLGPKTSRNTHEIVDMGISRVASSQAIHETYCLMTKIAKNAFFSFATLNQVANDSRKTLTLVFQHKNKLEILKNKVSTKLKNREWWKTLPKANKIIKNLFDSIMISLSKHTSHLIKYNHTNEIDIHWTLDLCVVYEYQVWISP